VSDTTLPLEKQHAAVRESGGFRPIEDRRLFEVTGKDRTEWLHNLVTNTVRTLKTGEGNYAFAVNTQGRTLFDLNIWVHAETLWLDFDTRWADDAVAHLNKYVIVEDVHVAEITTSWSRYAVLGPRTGAVIDRLGFGGNFEALADMQHVSANVDGSAAHAVKADLGPILRAELIVEASAGGFSDRLAEACGAVGMVPIGADLAEMIRMEVGVPRSVDDIDHAVIPPETLQIERGINYVKGCYLGQEVLERMRSRRSMARRLVGWRVGRDVLPAHDTPVFADDKEIGRITSACHSVALDGVLALGYAKVALIESGKAMVARLDEQETVDLQMVKLPLPPW